MFIDLHRKLKRIALTFVIVVGLVFAVTLKVNAQPVDLSGYDKGQTGVNSVSQTCNNVTITEFDSPDLNQPWMSYAAGYGLWIGRTTDTTSVREMRATIEMGNGTASFTPASIEISPDQANSNVIIYGYNSSGQKTGTGITVQVPVNISQLITLNDPQFTSIYKLEIDVQNSTFYIVSLDLSTKTATTTSLSSSSNPSVYGDTVTFTATVTSGATGSVTFKDGTTTLGTGTLSAGNATYTTSALAAGGHSITAEYGGDSSYAPSTSTAVSQTVKSVSTTALTSSPNPSVYGDTVTFTATVTSGATGTVTFKDGATTLGTGTLSAGNATYTTSALALGGHSITAEYGGNSSYAPSTSGAVSQTVKSASTTALTSSSNPSVYGGTVTFTATVTSGATGTVTFKDGATTLGTATLSGGQATYTTSALAGGSHSIAAVYSGDLAYAASTSSTVTQVVTPASSSTVLSINPNPSTYGDSVTLTAVVTSGATGTVTFKDGMTTLGTATLSGGQATCTTAALKAGDHSITAVYAGDANYSGSTSAAITQTVNLAASTTVLNTNPNPSTYGASVTLTATVPSDATGTVTFKDGTATLGTATPSGGQAVFMTSALSVGSHSITAQFAGDSNYSGSTSAGITQVVNHASSTTVLNANPNPSTYGQTVTLTATVPSDATGDVTFKEGATTLGTAAVNGGQASFTTSALAVGDHSVTAEYAGDGNYSGSTSTALTQVVNIASSTTVLTASPSPSTYGQTVTMTATVTSDATGTMTFKDGSTILGTAAVSGGQASFTTSALSVGNHTMTAEYSGDTNYNGSVSASISQTVNKITSTTALTSSSNPSAYGDTVTFTATVTAGATGTVTFKDGASTLGTATLSGGQATYTTSALTGGSHSITAVYSGDPAYAASTSATVTQAVAPAYSSTVLSINPNPSTYGDSVTLTAVVTSGATGTVTFKDGMTTLGTATLSGGQATCTTAALKAGDHSITAVYDGDANYSGSTSAAITQTVNLSASTTVLNTNPNPSTYGASVTLTATVPSDATGTVTFKDGTATMGTATPSGGQAVFMTSALSVGSHSITAQLAGDANYSGSTSVGITQVVNPASSTTVLNANPNPSTYGQTVTLTATVPSGATGDVTFKEGATTLGMAAVNGGQASFTTSALAVGNHSVTAEYAGDNNYSGSTSTALTQVVNIASSTTVLTASPSPSTYGQTVTMTATVTSDATGTMTFKDGSTILGTAAVSGGQASFTTSALSVGNHTMTAEYSGDTNYNGSVSASISQTVNKITSTTTLGASPNPSEYGQSVTLTVTVTPGATGTVTFKDGTTTLGTATVISGQATYTASGLTAATHSLSAVYNGDSVYTASTSPLVSLTVNTLLSSTSLNASSNPSTYGQLVTFTATVTSGATGTVTFKDGTTTLGTATLSGGQAIYTTSALAGGTHSMTAEYSGDSVYSASTSETLSQIVSPASSTTTLSADINPTTYGQAVTFTATVTTGATGTVTFKDGATTLAAGTLNNGTATFTTSVLPVGSHSITATYAGNADFAGSTSSILTQTVNTAPLANPDSLAWDGTNPGIAKASWGSVSNAVSYTVQLYKDGVAVGSPVTGVTATYYDFTSSITEAASYTFKVTAIGDGKTYSDSATITVSASLSAYVCSFENNYSDSDTSAFSTQVVISGGKLTMPNQPVRSGYNFGGWYKERTVQNAWNFRNDTVAGSTMLYAKWTEKPIQTYTVTYNGNGANSGSVPVDKNDYVSGSSVAVKGNIGSLAKAGYSFGGWSLNSATYAAGQTISITGDLTLMAVWTPAPATYTVTYSYNYSGAGTYTTQANVASNSTLTLPPAPSRDAYTFIGWYRDAACANPWDFASCTVTADTTLFAKWTAVTHTVSGSVVDDQTPAAGVGGATVKVMKGNVQFGTTAVTNGSGDFTVTGVPDGVYNLMVSKDGQEVVVCITVGGDVATGSIVLPHGNKNSKLDVVGSETPNVVVDHLNDVFQDANVYTSTDASTVTDGGTVEIKLTVQKNDGSTNKDRVEAAMSSGGYTAGVIMDVDLTKTVTFSNGAQQETGITDTDSMIKLVIPLPAALQGKSNYVIYRAHDYGNGPVVDTITTTANVISGEYIEVSSDKSQLTLYAKYFSTYAIAYSEPVSPSISYGGSQSYTIAATAGEGGDISPKGDVSLVRGSSQTFTITANAGYSISDVQVDGISVGAVGSYTFNNIAEAHTISALFVKTAGLPYYVDAGGNKVFIGFASDASGTMKYIAPDGKSVQFQVNPKDFTDISEHWAKTNIDFVTEREIFLGTGDNVFSPDTGMTRAMFATVIGRLYERSFGSVATVGSRTEFTDMDQGAYYVGYVNWAAENGIITGVGGGRFEPDRQITREEMAAILYRFAEFLKISGTGTGGTQLSYPDAAGIAAWATDAAKYCQQTGIIKGRDGGNFVANGIVTRAEVAAILERFIDNVVDYKIK